MLFRSRNTRDVPKMTWKEFAKLFMERFFPQVYREQKKSEFIHLLQRMMSVTEYETRFTSLSRFAEEMVADEAMKCRKFESGLVPDIAELVVVHGYTDYQQLITGALRAEKQLAETRRIRSARGSSTGGSSASQTSQARTQSDRKSTRLNSSHEIPSRMPSSA